MSTIDKQIAELLENSRRHQENYKILTLRKGIVNNGYKDPWRKI